MYVLYILINEKFWISLVPPPSFWGNVMSEDVPFDGIPKLAYILIYFYLNYIFEAKHVDLIQEH